MSEQTSTTAKKTTSRPRKTAAVSPSTESTEAAEQPAVILNTGTDPVHDAPNLTTGAEEPEGAPDLTTGSEGTTDLSHVEAAPLDPPPHLAPEDAPDLTNVPVQIAEIGVNMAVQGGFQSFLADGVTGEPPADPDTIFVPVLTYGTEMQSTIRIEQVTPRQVGAPDRVMVLAEGARIPAPQAEVLVAVLKQQAADRQAAE